MWKTNRFFTTALLAFTACVLFTACPQKEKTQNAGAVKEDKEIPASRLEGAAAPVLNAPAQNANAVQTGADGGGAEDAASAQNQQGIARQKAASEAGEKQSGETFADEAAARNKSAEEQIVDQGAKQKLSGASDAASKLESEMDALFNGD